MSAKVDLDSNRIILHFDYDCFYAAVVEADQPSLKTRPLAIQQKQIVVTCNYEARRRGLYKLQRLVEARQLCPDVVVVLGEDLTRFRDVSRELYLYLKEGVWGDRAERLGLDELFLDVTDMIDYNVDLLNPHDRQHAFFHLDRLDPTVGFPYDATDFCGPTWPSSTVDGEVDSRPRLVVASHLAGHLRHQLLSQKGYSATVGISASKLLAKLAGNVHKPNNQTTLLPPNSNIARFLDDHQIRKIPGIGHKMAEKLHVHLSRSPDDDPLTVRDVRLSPGMGPALLDRIFQGPGSSRGIGARIWGLLHGVDESEVLEARDLPTQISIEDSYGRLDRLEAVKHELTKLATSLLRRMRIDLTESDANSGSFRWRAHPRTLRLSSRLRTPNPENPYHHPRCSRSAPLPRFVFNLDDRVEVLAERLVQEHVLALFRRLHPERNGWTLSLLNIAVTNMVDGADRGRDIGTLFRRQEMRPGPAVPESKSRSGSEERGEAGEVCESPAWEDNSEDDDEFETSCSRNIRCGRCRGLIPWFAVEAHEQYHQAPD